MTSFNETQTKMPGREGVQYITLIWTRKGAPGGLEITPGMFNGVFYSLFTTSIGRASAAPTVTMRLGCHLLQGHHYSGTVGITGCQPHFYSAFFFSVQGTAAIATEQDPVLQLFAQLETSLSSSRFKPTRNWSSLSLSQVFSCLYCSKNITLSASIKGSQLNSL